MAEEPWEDVYRRRGPDEVSWFQAEPATSLALIGAVMGPGQEPLLDVGGGASVLVDRLLDRGYGNVAVLDAAPTALARSRSRLGPRSASVRWIHADVTRWEPEETWALWHDRAVLHFMVDPEDRRGYLRALERGLRPGGHLVVAAFSPRGPERCSGRPVARYSARDLQEVLGPGFELLDSLLEEHVTPGGTGQEFQWAVFRRLGGL